MKKLKKINLNLDKEVISSLSGNEMNSIKGGTFDSYGPNGCSGACMTADPKGCGYTVTCPTAGAAVGCGTFSVGCASAIPNECLTKEGTNCKPDPTTGGGPTPTKDSSFCEIAPSVGIDCTKSICATFCITPISNLCSYFC